MSELACVIDDTVVVDTRYSKPLPPWRRYMDAIDYGRPSLILKKARSSMHHYCDKANDVQTW